MVHERIGPNVPEAHSFEVHSCGNPECGPHFILFNEDGKPILEMVWSRQSTLKTIEALQRLLYDKATDEESDG